MISNENGETYEPSFHAYSGHIKKVNGEDIELCWYCNKAKALHKKQVVITKQGERKIVDV